MSTFLQIAVFDTDGNLTRLIEFDDDRLDEALAELALVSGQPVGVGLGLLPALDDGRPNHAAIVSSEADPLESATVEH